jgi:hypothetical protein
VRDIGKTFGYSDISWATRLISLCMRNKITIEDIVSQMNKSDSKSMHAFNKAIVRVLQKYTNRQEEFGKQDDTCLTGNCE